MKEKKIGLAITVGGPEKEYKKDGIVSHTVDELLLPFIVTINYVGAKHIGNFILFDAVPETEDKVIDESSEKYVDYILKD